MLADAIEVLRCPHCAGGLALEQRTVRCANGHSYDVARQGYVNLLSGDAETGTADTAAMVQARDEFLEKGLYRPIADAVADAAGGSAAAGGWAIDLGAGTGYYLAAALDGAPHRTGLALDISKHACARATRAHPRIAAVVCDAWSRLPVGDRVAAAVLSVFSPRNPGEIARVLEPEGALVVVTPTDRHLGELIPLAGLLKVGERKRERLDVRLRSRFTLAEETSLEYEIELDRAAAAALVAMGPSSYHLDPGELEQRIAALPEPLRVTVSVTVSVFRPTGSHD